MEHSNTPRVRGTEDEDNPPRLTEKVLLVNLHVKFDKDWMKHFVMLINVMINVGSL